MAGAFACPECGSEVLLDGMAPGLLVRCATCETDVEVPYIPRGPSRRHRSRRKAPWWAAWAWAALALSAVLIAISAAGRISQARERQAMLARLEALTAEADAQVRAGLPGLALAEIEAALKLAREGQGTSPDVIGNLSRRRDDLARREIEMLLATPQATLGDFGVGIWEGLGRRAFRDPALAAQSGEILARLDQARVRWANAELNESRRAAEAGDPMRALALADHADRLASALNPGDAAPLRQTIEARVAALVGEFGVVVEPTRGEFLLGTSAEYDASLLADMTESLTRRGYLPRPGSKAPGASWAELWVKGAPFRASIRVRERYRGHYLQSQNRMSQVGAEMWLERSGQRVWTETAEARTPETLSARSGYAESRLGTARQSAADERVLYDQARGPFVRECRRKLASMPKLARPPSR